jgi:hypothetical protein
VVARSLCVRLEVDSRRCVAAIEAEGSMSVPSSGDEPAREHLGFEILLSPDDVVRILGLEKLEQIYELIRPQARSPLPFVRVGKYLRFRPSEVREWLDQNRSAPRNRINKPQPGRRTR